MGGGGGGGGGVDLPKRGVLGKRGTFTSTPRVVNRGGGETRHLEKCSLGKSYRKSHRVKIRGKRKNDAGPVKKAV